MSAQKFVGVFNPEWQLVAVVKFSPPCHCEESSTRQSHTCAGENSDCFVAEPPRNDTNECLAVTDLTDHPYSQIIAGALDRLKTENPKLHIPVKDEEGCVIDMLRVGPEDERYLDGVANELRRPGLRAYALSSALLDILKKVNQASTALRVQVVPEVIGLDTDHALTALEAIL